MSKTSKIPFIATHRLTAEVKTGTMLTEVMAVNQDGVTRLFDAEEAAAGKLPEWRLKNIITGASPITEGLQRNRKDAKGELVRISQIVSFDTSTGEMVSTREELPSTAPTTAMTDLIARGDAAADLRVAAVAGAIEQGADPVAAAKLAAKIAQKAAKDAEKAAKKAAVDAKKAAKTGKIHREGSVQGMNIDQLRAEFTAKTKLPAPSNSIHYMRKMVLAARRGKTEFKARAVKVPTMTLTLEEATALQGGKGRSEAKAAVVARIAEFVKANEESTIPPPAAMPTPTEVPVEASMA